MLSLLAAHLLVPPPPEGDDRTAILYTVRSTLDALLAGESPREAFLPEATFPTLDARGEGEATAEVRSLDAMMAMEWTDATYREPFGIPTVLQHGGFAQVWVPYSFWIDGEKVHCGTDNVTLVRVGSAWKIAQFGFTMTPLSSCEALGAPTVADPE